MMKVIIPVTCQAADVCPRILCEAYTGGGVSQCASSGKPNAPAQSMPCTPASDRLLRWMQVADLGAMLRFLQAMVLKDGWQLPDALQFMSTNAARVLQLPNKGQVQLAFCQLPCPCPCPTPCPTKFRVGEDYH